MANLSLAKRERLINFLENIKEQHKDDDNVLVSIGEIENEVLSKKYGLLWEEHEENVDVKMRNSIPVFKEVKEKEIALIDGPLNFILEGDNLHSLYLLEKTCKEKIDCIYIDPPYNTGAKDWKYNNNYVDKNDMYRHSKWLSMMNARLKIAKRLLKEDGVLVCAIDENELGTTLLLLEDIFGIAYAIDPITVVHNPRGVQGDNFSYVNEYAIFVYRRGWKVIENQQVMEENVDWSSLRNWGTESLRHDAANCFYPIYIKDGVIIGFGEDVTNVDSFHPSQTEYDENSKIYSVYPIDVNGIERKWRYARQTVESIKHLLRVKTTGTGFDIELGKNYAPYRTVWTDKKYDANEYGTQLISSMIPDNDFSFPKSIHNVYECLRAVTLYRPNAIILDFFAGSGTTGHATLMLNKELGGYRRFILCTNNDVGETKENEFKNLHGEIEYTSIEWAKYCNKYGIASSVTYPRIKAAIEGFVHKKDFKEVLFDKKLTPTVIKNSKKLLDDVEALKQKYSGRYDELKSVVEDSKFKVIGVTKKGHNIEGIPANLKYFQTDFVSYDEEYLSVALLDHIVEMIELEHGVKIDGENYAVVLDDEQADVLEVKIDSLHNLKGIYISKSVMLTTSQNTKFSHVNLETIPDYYFSFELKESGESW